ECLQVTTCLLQSRSTCPTARRQHSGTSRTPLGLRHYRAGLRAAQAQLTDMDRPCWGAADVLEPVLGPSTVKTSRQGHSAWSWKRARSAVATEPGAPLPTGRSSIRTTGITIWLAEVRNASRAP